MRSLAAGIQAIINESRLTSFAVCWRIRKNDGTFLYGTEHDRDIEIDSGDLAGLYQAQFNISGSDIKSSSDFAVDNLEVAGASEQLFASSIDVADIESGVLDSAQVLIFLVDWTNPSAGQVTVRAGYIGQISRDSSTRYRAEVRGLLQKLSQQIGKNYSEECNVVRFGDERCMFDVASITQDCIVETVTNRKVFTCTIADPSAATLPVTLPRGGEVQWTSGDNTGFTREVKVMTLDNATFTITLYEESAADIQIGDSVSVVPGCDRTAVTCRFTYDNLDNFRGYGIFIPGILAIMRGNSIEGCIIPSLVPDGGGGAGEGEGGNPPIPPVTPPPPPGEEPPITPPPVLPPPSPDGREILWDGSLRNGRIGPGTWLGDGFVGCKYEPEGGVNTWASSKIGTPAIVRDGSVATNLDQHVTAGETWGGVAVPPRFPGTYFVRQVLDARKQYEVVNNHLHPSDNHWDKTRCYWAPLNRQTGHDFDREVWFGCSRYLHPNNTQDPAAPRNHAGGPAFHFMEAQDNNTQFIIGMYKPPLNSTSGYTGPLGGSFQHWVLWWTLNANSPDQPSHSFGAAGSNHVSLGSVEDDVGLWTDLVVRYRINPFTASTNAATRGGRNHVYEGNKGILQVWKSVGPYLDGNRNRAMSLVFSRFNQPVGCVPHPTLRMEGMALGVYHYGWKHNATSSVLPRYYGVAQARWGFRRPPQSNEVFDQSGTRDIDVNPSGGALSGWSEQS